MSVVEACMRWPARVVDVCLVPVGPEWAGCLDAGGDGEADAAEHGCGLMVGGIGFRGLGEVDLVGSSLFG